MADGFIGLFTGISFIFGSFFNMQFLGTNIGTLIVAFGVSGMILSFLVRRYLT